MPETEKNEPGADLEALEKIIGQLDELLTDLGRLGGEMPVIEKNVRAMKSFVAVLKYGISDLAEIKKSECWNNGIMVSL
jgi:hypothetical protein